MKMTGEEAKFSLFSNNQGKTRKVQLSELSWRSSKSQFDTSQFVHTYLLAFTGPVRFCCRARNQYTVPGVIVERLRATWIQQRIATRSRPPPSNMLGRLRCKWKSILANNRRAVRCGCDSLRWHAPHNREQKYHRNLLFPFSCNFSCIWTKTCG